MTSFSFERPRTQTPFDFLPFHEWKFQNGVLWTQFFRISTGYLLRFPNLADFRISQDGWSVACSPAPDANDETAHHLYLNQVLPLMLSRQGELVFHASAVEIEASAVAFVAGSGRGKSTLAASFATGGFRFLTDDGLVLKKCGLGYLTLPSHPSIRLWEDSAKAVVAPGTMTAPALEYTSKARFLAGKDIAFCDQPRPLRRVYFLGDGRVSKIAFQRMSAADVLVEWVKNSFLLDVEEKQSLAFHFDEVAKLATQLIYYRLDYPRQFEDLVRFREAIVEHATSEVEVV